MTITKLLSSTAMVCASLAAAAPAWAQTAPAGETPTPTEAEDPATLNPQSEVEIESGQNADDNNAGQQITVTVTGHGLKDIDTALTRWTPLQAEIVAAELESVAAVCGLRS